ncbi:carboxypeptidase regulatory-like domain-containing protein [Lysobacter arvi]|uniref:Carboxypeptidase regulatory-like domain-containing protein n=1 Tax=Lysobacter arvi TaxID=3038776 RepID=A0ABU1CFY7_9GAMM|nr:carboxypeptidase regulatory-like domain-containing protein [Lysobacter arvi]MDR0183871.1 carboxypeptidase regulatory-like domain-containing protein [Lysobacter arvi]
MTPWITPATTAWVLALATAIAVARLIAWRLRAEPSQRSHGARVATLLIAQPLCAALLYFALWPPTVPGRAGTLVVATSGAQRTQAAAGNALIALPEAPMWPDVERAPDLATALRRHPGTQRVRVIGEGLDARDREAVSGVAVEFAPSAAPRGLVELHTQAQVAAGDEFNVAGRVGGVDGGAVELFDPARRRVDRTTPGRDGRFVLSATARGEGSAMFRVRVLDAHQRLVEEVDAPVQVEPQTPPRVLVIAGAPNPEVKYLRRWLEDAGMPAQTQMAVGGGVQLGDAPIAIDAATLARFDMAILDERAWSSLGDAQRGALDAAVRDGLGLLVRVTGALSSNERSRLRALGFAVDGGRESRAVKLAQGARDDAAERARLGPGTQDAPRSHEEPPAELPDLTRRDAKIGASDGVPLLRDANGATLGLWRAHGRGRVGVWVLTDTFRLVLAGRDDRHAQLWSDALAMLSRARSRASFDIDADAWEGQRMSLRGVQDGASVVAPGGTVHALMRDPAARGCAAFWPRAGGWHRLRSGDREQAFFVRARDAAPALRVQAMRDATWRLAASSHAATDATASQAPRRPGERWPWWLAWLVASAALWWFERSRVGRRVSAA